MWLTGAHSHKRAPLVDEQLQIPDERTRNIKSLPLCCPEERLLQARLVLPFSLNSSSLTAVSLFLILLALPPILLIIIIGGLLPCQAVLRGIPHSVFRDYAWQYAIPAINSGLLHYKASALSLYYVSNP